MTNYEGRITNDEIRMTNYEGRITNDEIRMTKYEIAPDLHTLLSRTFLLKGGG